MAKKPVKKAPAKKAPVKKTVAAAAPAAPVVVAAPACAGTCGCKGGSKFGRFFKKLIIFLIIFALGFAAGKFCCMSHHYKGMGFGHPKFVEGCLDTSKIQCPKMLEKFAAMDTNGDGCITKEEFWEAKKAMKAARDEQHSGCPYSEE